MVGESPSSSGMTEELLTSRFGSHESVCKPDQPDLGQVMVGRVGETGKVDQLRRNIYKVGFIRYWMCGMLHHILVSEQIK